MPSPPRLIARALMVFVRGYQVLLGPLLGGHCRFTPTCSNYALDALRQCGALRGSWLTIRRVAKCHPWGGSGYDPVPCDHSENAEQPGPR